MALTCVQCVVVCKSDRYVEGFRLRTSTSASHVVNLKPYRYKGRIDLTGAALPACAVKLTLEYRVVVGYFKRIKDNKHASMSLLTR
jgi:hypothetical protein